MKVFPPGPVNVGRWGRLVFEGARRDHRGVQGVYRVDPLEQEAFTEVMAGLREEPSVRYAPLMGTWATFEACEDEVPRFVVGVGHGPGRALQEAHTTLRTPARTLVPTFMVGLLAQGYVEHVGAA